MSTPRDHARVHALLALAEFLDGHVLALGEGAVLAIPDHVLVRLGVPVDRLLSAVGAHCLADVPMYLRRLAAHEVIADA